MFHNNIMKISEKFNKWNLLKIFLQVTYPTDFCIICIHFYYGKNDNIWFFKKKWLEQNILCIGSYDKWLCTK